MTNLANIFTTVQAVYYKTQPSRSSYFFLVPPCRMVAGVQHGICNKSTVMHYICVQTCCEALLRWILPVVLSTGQVTSLQLAVLGLHPYTNMGA